MMGLCGPLSDLCAALHICETEGPSRGLLLNWSKSLLIIPPDALPPSSFLAQGVPIIAFTLRICAQIHPELAAFHHVGFLGRHLWWSHLWMELLENIATCFFGWP